jgi:uncharacterized protein (TIGR03437 family)
VKKADEGVGRGPGGPPYFTKAMDLDVTAANKRGVRSKNRVFHIAIFLFGPAVCTAQFPILTQYSNPVVGGGSSIISGPDGNLWFTDGIHVGKSTTSGVITLVATLADSSEAFDITAGPDGNLWLPESETNKIARVTPAGVVTEFAVPTPNGAPTAITRGPDGNLWFAENANNIARITTAGSITEFPIPSTPAEPSGITAGPDGNLWFTEFLRSKIGRITTAGLITEFPITGDPDSIVVGPDGNLWFTEPHDNNIGRITTSGVSTVFALPTSGASPQGITAGPDGNVWFTETNANKIGRITPSGVILEFPLSTLTYVGPTDVTIGPDGNLWFTESGGPGDIAKVSGAFTLGSITIFNLNPNSSQVGAAGFTMTVNGSGFVAGSTVEWNGSPLSTSYTNGTLTASVPANLVASASNAIVTVVNQDGSVSNTAVFTTSGAPAPRILSLSPNSNVGGGSSRLIVTGSGFVPPTSIQWDGLPFGDTNVSGSPTTELVCQCEGGGPGNHSVTVMNPDGSISNPAIFTVIPSTQTQVYRATNAFATATDTIAPNTWVAITGVNLAPAGDSRTWRESDFVNNQMPTQLDGVSVIVYGKPAYVYYISPTQINILTPPDSLDPPGYPQNIVPVQLFNTAGFGVTLAVAEAISPAFFTFPGLYVVATHADGSLIGPTTLYPGSTTPAKPGEIIVIYANGFGPTSVPVISGSRTQSGVLSPLPVVKIGDVPAEVQFAGLVAPGEFQFNVVVPSPLGDGDQPITATYQGFTAQPGILLTIQN